MAELQRENLFVTFRKQISFVSQWGECVGVLNWHDFCL